MTDVVLHIGTGKTGTSSLQELLGRNRQELARAGVLYPRAAGRYRHVKLAMMLTPDEELSRTILWRRTGRDDPEQYRAEIRAALEEEIAAAALPRVLYSNEGFYGASKGSLELLRTYLEQTADRVTVLVYLRRQDDHLVSRYQQRVKVGATDRLADWARSDLGGTYDYAVRLRRWRRAVKPDAMVVRPFERAQFTDGSLEADFLGAAGIEVDAGALTTAARTNESLDAESVELLRLLNLDQVENGGARVGQIDNRALLEQITARPRGATLGLPDDVLDPFMATWAATNAEVARTYLGREDGTLFRSTRRSGDVETSQVLEPRRVAALLDELGFTRADRRRVVRIARREVRTAAAG